ncbi:MAG: flagellin, partial [Synergistaceae bacterium]|nr:flagellin [Synergistaceae bacterium]
QRMRELAVQAANDTLTQEDRSYIQLEVDELKNQVDNIANTTQFNKKRLLDGSCAGNWSSNDLRVKAYVRGSLREIDQFGQKSAFEGNFKIRIDASATGAGEVQKTSIFKIKHPNVITDVSLNTEDGVEAVRVDNIPAGDFTIKAAKVETEQATPYTTDAISDITVTGQATDAKATVKISLANGGEATAKVDIASDGADGTILGSDLIEAIKGMGLQGLTVAEDETDPTKLVLTSTKGAVTLEIANDDTTNANAIAAPSVTAGTAKDVAKPGATVTGAYGLEDVDTTLIDMKTTSAHNASILFEVVSVGKDSVTLKASSNVLSADGNMENHMLDNIILTQGDTTASTAGSTFKLGSLLGEADYTFTMNLLANVEASAFEAGDKFVVNVLGAGGGKDSEGNTIIPDMTVKISGTQDQNWPDKWDKDVTLDELQYNLDSSKVQNREVHFRNYYLNSDNGKVYEGDVVVTTNDKFVAANMDLANKETLASFTSAYIGKIATGDTCLRDLDKFWNASGVFMLEDPQTLTITQGDGKSATVTLYATDTINDLKNKLNNAIANDLGQGQYVTSDANKFVTFVEDPENSGFETVQGTFLIRSIIPGTAGSLTFSGDEDFINAFATNIVSKSSETSFTASLYDAHTGSAIATGVTVTGNKLIGVLHENVDIEFDPLADIK